LLVSELNGSSEEIGKYYEESMKIYSDRAEPYYYWGLYCNQHRNFEKSYTLFKKAILISYKDAIIKYPETHYNVYGKYLYDELSVACYWLTKYDEAKNLLEKIINDPDFANSRERLQKNLVFTLKELQSN
jgi:tetratricopeptide (TPR) repeat protein